MENSSDTFAFILMDSYFTNEIRLTDKLQPGFANIYASFGEISWKVHKATIEPISKQDLIYFGNKILNRLLSNLKQNKAAIELLFQILKPIMEVVKMDLIQQEIEASIERKTIPQISEEIRNITNFPNLYSIIERRKELSIK
ncbi:MAG: hypothetical protein IPP71_10050 [Bacteroidetes bacterium]|nr:hypothetical protein [Bacteroidota bacterium]